MNARVAVVGGGISGLSAAYTLARAGVPAILFEAAPRLGGKIRTETIDGIGVDVGPDAFLARDPWAADLARAVGLEDDLVAPAVFGACIYSRGRLRRMPPASVFGIPASPVAALRNGLISPLGAVRAALDLVLPQSVGEGDVSIGELVRTRLGSEVLERMVDPLLAGTRAGHPDSMSLQAAAPPVYELARAHRSLIAGLYKARRKGAVEPGPPPFLGIKGGLQRLVDAVVDRIRDRIELRPAAEVTRVDVHERRCVVRTADGGEIEVERAIVATPPYAAADVITGLPQRATELLASIPYASAATATLVYPPGSFTPPPGTSGVLVPRVEASTLAAATWYSTKWPDRAPADGRQVVKCFAGRSTDDAVVALDDDDLGRALAAEHDRAVNARHPPATITVTRWPRALPQYEVGHVQRMQELERALTGLPLSLAGSGRGGSGIPDAIERGQRAAADAVGAITSR